MFLETGAALAMGKLPNLMSATSDVHCVAADTMSKYNDLFAVK
jgi:hypothetical protein